jgi:polyhydroxybutyrate depolymerase
MSCVLAAARSDLVSAVGAVAGLRSGGRHTPTRPVPILAFHGTADRINPYLAPCTLSLSPSRHRADG